MMYHSIAMFADGGEFALGWWDADAKASLIKQIVPGDSTDQSRMQPKL